MKKSTYIFISLLLSTEFWQLSFVVSILNRDIILGLTWIWAFSSFYLFKTNKISKYLYSLNYIKYIYFIFLGVLMSMFSAKYSWGQSFSITLLSQRGIYSFILLPAILYAQPSERDIIKALRWITVGTIIVWILSYLNFNIVKLDNETIDRIYHEKKNGSTKLGFYVNGIYYVILYLYFNIGEYIKRFSTEKLIEIIFLIIFLVFYQNRSMLIGALPIFLYSLLKFKSKYKIILLIIVSILILTIIIYTYKIWITLILNSQIELTNSDYNRWKSLYYYLNDYSPNLFCYIFGNGFPSGGNSRLGNTMWDNFTQGIYASDLGMIGMWTIYGIIPLIAIYSIIFRVIIKKYFPMYMKFVSLHILFVPTIFYFSATQGTIFFVIYIYLFAYYSVRFKLDKRYNKLHAINRHKLNVNLPR